VNPVARIWKEPSSGAVPAEYWEPTAIIEHRYQNRALVPHFDIMVNVASFTFRFSSLRQLRDCLSFYEQKTRKSGALAEQKLALELGPDWRSQRGWEIERWYERLPMYFQEEPKRKKVIQALTKALQMTESGRL
jgi:hypothetical protein